jgi:hypothetical protein
MAEGSGLELMWVETARLSSGLVISSPSLPDPPFVLMYISLQFSF